MSDEDVTPETIWADDLFGRRAEAELLIAYLESVADRPSIREDSHGYTIAVDGRYGEGKTFFLKRLARHLSLDHPVAFVDAWSDDLADEPLTALAATLKKALDPLIQQSSDVRSKFDDVVAKSGKIAKIVGSGLLKKGVGLLITTAAAEAAADVISDMGEEVQDVAKEALKSSGSDAVEGAVKAYQSVAPGKLMDDRISDFEEGQKALREMKESLAALVNALEEASVSRPIFIIIDELDRCRPTYAVKLLEEIKHLFDVAGIVFILGLHGDQLAHSISAAYGTGFDSKSYLRRFFNRQYRLAEPDLEPFITKLCEDAGIMNARFRLSVMIFPLESPVNPTLPQFIARYVTAYGLSARNAFEVIDILQTCSALVRTVELYLVYLLPLIIGHIKGLPSGQIPKMDSSTRWRLYYPRDHFGREGDEYAFNDAAKQFEQALELDFEQLSVEMNRDQRNPAINAVWQTSAQQPEAMHSVRNYPKLLTMVSRFSNPQIQGQ